MKLKYSDILLDIIRNNSNNKISRNQEYRKIVISETPFMSSKYTIMERIWYIKNNIDELVSCPICHKTAGHINLIRNSPKTCSTKCQHKLKVKTLQKPDIETGLTGYQLNSIKRDEKLSKIDVETGLTGYQKINKKSNDTMLIIDPETGLNGNKLRGIKSKSSNLEIDPETGLTGYQRATIKIKTKLNQIDPATGYTGYEKRSKSAAKTMSKIDPSTGLTIFETSVKKARLTMSKIDPETGLTRFQEIANKAAKTMSKIDENTGLSIYDTAGIKNSITQATNGYNLKVINFPSEYKLLTTIQDYLKNPILKYKHTCGSIRESYWPYIRCTKCYPYNKSIGENEVLKFCQSLVNNIDPNSRQIIKPLELDIYLPVNKLAIEYDGIFYHSSDSAESENKNYHLIKTQECEKQGIQLFHIFENEWGNPRKQEIWKSIIRNRLGKSERIYARKTKIRSVSSKDKSRFLNSNHLQGSCNSSVNWGLYLDDELVSVMTFGKSRYDKNIDWELLRFCNKIGYSVTGGASKLLKAFTDEYSGSIISYADKRRSNGNLYKQLGFELSHESNPNYFYFKNNSIILESRLKYQKHKLKDKLDVFDNDKTESENMYENGYRKIYDCGNQVWVKYNDR